jgi:hypothetical protein
MSTGRAAAAVLLPAIIITIIVGILAVLFFSLAFLTGGVTPVP